MGLRYGLSGNRVVTMVTGQREHERGTTSIGDETMLPGKTNPTEAVRLTIIAAIVQL